ncbi:MAG TPA: TfoX domain containing protein [Janthinobacterium sp.]|nr:TfoX domain containing protein [Janthinobacterium sp.]
MSASSEFVSFVRELFAPLGQLSDGKFFGGHSIKYRGSQFAMVMGNTLYLRVNDVTRPEYEREGAKPFFYTTKKGVVQVRKYYAAPEALLDDQEQLLVWARRAINAAGEL